MNGKSNNTVLIDTSVWIEVLSTRRSNAPLGQRVRQLVLADQAATTGPVRLELLRGSRTQQEWEQFDDVLEGLRYLVVADETWTSAARLGSQLARLGLTLPIPDLLIAAVAIDENATLLHRDRHFDLMAAHVPLKVESAL
ncbi:MAG: PIN domain-containing protein [Chloroflexi bacterium]|nr:PIN domain-containing protein [Chloroflexota bacterium]